MASDGRVCSNSATAWTRPQLTAKDGYLDKIIFDGSAGIFLSLVDIRADMKDMRAIWL
jgi:hypothetical protein